ncbi:unnamed protein product [Schistocephalus solidus]|uniref:SH3 domain-containing protein n=1 Tax=Schistocephalus solidus TaxID=70667 RepID=A0A3P7D6N6_SCHSO|nr:unnamed protein product [Schistocephalus solidus]
MIVALKCPRYAFTMPSFSSFACFCFSMLALPPADAAPKGEWVRVMFQYTPEQPDELELQVGEIIQVLDRNLSEEGWWRGQNVKTKKMGVFPDNFVELLDPNKPEVQKLLSEAQVSPSNCYFHAFAPDVLHLYDI